MPKLTRLPVVCAVVLGLATTGCGSDSASGSGDGSTTTTRTRTTTKAKVTGNINVSDAASLTDAFEEIGAEFRRANPGATTTFNPASSSALAAQIEQGAPVDAFASADEANMAKLVEANLIDGQPVVFARNTLTIVTKPGNPKKVKDVADLADVGVVSLCGATVPCGRYAASVLAKAGVTIPETRVTRGVDARSVLSAVTTGDAEAAIVYVTDAKSAGSKVGTVSIPDSGNVTATYPIATVATSGNKATSRAFIDSVLSPKGQATLQSFGFLPPP